MLVKVLSNPIVSNTLETIIVAAIVNSVGALAESILNDTANKRAREIYRRTQQ